MKKTLLIAIAFSGIVTVRAVAQETVKKEVRAEEKMAEIKSASEEEKTVKAEMIEVGGKKQLKVITTEKGEETIEFFEGKAADTKLKEIEEAEATRRRKVNIIEPKKKTIEKVNY